MSESKENLLRKKAEVDFELQSLNIKLQRARARAVHNRIYMDSKEYENLQLRQADLKRQSQLLQVKIGEANYADKAMKSVRIEKAFVDIAKMKLPTEVFREIMKLAQAHFEDL